MKIKVFEMIDTESGNKIWPFDEQVEWFLRNKPGAYMIDFQFRESYAGNEIFYTGILFYKFSFGKYLVDKIKKLIFG